MTISAKPYPHLDTQTVMPVDASLGEAQQMRRQLPERSRWAQILIWSFTLTAEGIHGTVANGLFPAIRASLALPLSALGMLQALPQLAGALAGPVWNLLAERTDRKKVLIVCATVGGACVGAAGCATSLGQLVVLYTLGGICFSGSAPIVNALLADLFPAAQRGRALGLLYTVLALATAILGPVVGLLSHVRDGWRYGFFIAGAVCGVAGLLVAFFVADPGVGAAEPELAGFSKQTRQRFSRLGWPAIRTLFSNRTFTCSLVVSVFDKGGLLGGIAVVYLVDIYHFDNAAATVVALPAGIGGIVGTSGAGIVVDRVLGPARQGHCVYLLQMLMLLDVLIVVLCTQVPWGSLMVFCGLFFMYGMVIGASAVIGRPILLAVVLPEQVGAATAIQGSVSALCGAAVSAAISVLAQWAGLKMAVVLVVIAPTVCAMALITVMYRTLPQDAAKMRQDLRRRATDIASMSQK